jgi:hypothetical protein
VCFLGGSLLLGATTGAAGAVSVPPRTEQLTDAGRRDWRTGAELVRTCMATHNTRTGLAPEIVHFRIASDAAAVPDRGSDALPSDWYIKGGPPSAPVSLDARYILRPETVESLFVAWRLTGDARYRAHGWAIFSAIETHCRVATGGYASVRNVDALPVELEDKMETFMMVRAPLRVRRGRGLTRAAERDAQVPVPALLGRHRPPAGRVCVQHRGPCCIRACAQR